MTAQYQVRTDTSVVNYYSVLEIFLDTKCHPQERINKYYVTRLTVSGNIFGIFELFLKISKTPKTDVFAK